MAGDEFDDNPLEPAEALDSDEVRNDDGDQVVDPPDEWIEVEDHESLDERLSEETPDVSPDDIDPDDAEDADDESIVLTSDDELDRLPRRNSARARVARFDGTPREQSISFFNIVK